MRGNEAGDEEKMGSAWQEADIDEGAAEAVQLPQREADDLLLLGGNSSQDIEKRDTRIPTQCPVSSPVKWSKTQITD